LLASRRDIKAIGNVTVHHFDLYLPVSNRPTFLFVLRGKSVWIRFIHIVLDGLFPKPLGEFVPG
jgi:hypothetical protein